MGEVVGKGMVSVCKVQGATEEGRATRQWQWQYSQLRARSGCQQQKHARHGSSWLTRRDETRRGGCEGLEGVGAALMGGRSGWLRWDCYPGEEQKP